MSEQSPAPSAPAPSATPDLPDLSGIDFGAPAAPEPAAPSTPLGDGAAGGEQFSLHPSWEKTFDEAGIPDLLRPKLIEKIRADEAAVQRQIEAARGNLPPEWQSFLTDARESGVSPTELVNSYHAMQQLRTDPLTFQATLNAEIDSLVAAGHLTRAEGAQAKADAQQAVDQAQDDDFADLQTPEAKQIAELQRRLDEREAAEQAERERALAEQRAQQEEQQLIQEYDQLLEDSKAATLADQRLSAIVGNDPAKLLNAQVNVARLADSIYTGGVAATPAEAIKLAVAQITSLLPQQQAATPTAPPVQGGSSSMPVPTATKMTDAQREQAMIAEGLRQAGLA